MTPALRDKLAAKLGSSVTRTQRVSGGDINQVFDVTLQDGRRAIVKTNAARLPGLYAGEAEGLSRLADAQALRIPRVFSCDETFIAMELIEASARAKHFDEVLGRGLAHLHRQHLPSFGLDHDNYIAILPQPNAARATWAEFYGEQRLLAQLELAIERGQATKALRTGIELLCAKLPALVGRDEPPSLLHGDLWSGNLIVDEHGAPCLIDPAVYAGCREVDLAMMRLFGGFSERVFAAYEEAYPLQPEHEARVELYQLYPLLVHVNLFGGSYVAAAERVVARYA